MKRRLAWTLAMAVAVLIPTIWGAWTVLGLKPPVAWASVYSIEMSAYPVEGNPMAVQLVAEIRGGVDFAPGLYCQPREWQLGDRIMGELGMCRAWRWDAKLPRAMEYTHTFEAPGVYTLRVRYAWLESEPIEVAVPW